MHKEWSPELMAALAEPFDPALIGLKEVKDRKTNTTSKIPFVSWTHYVERLNKLVGPGWSDNVTMMHSAGGKLVVAVSVTILGVTRSNLGDENEAKDSFGTASTNAVAQAQKRACAKFGLGLYLYDKEERIKALALKNNPGKKMDGGGIISALPKTRDEIKRIMAERNLTGEHKAGIGRKLMNGLSEKDAQGLITWLKRQPEMKAGV